VPVVAIAALPQVSPSPEVVRIHPAGYSPPQPPMEKAEGVDATAARASAASAADDEEEEDDEDGEAIEDSDESHPEWTCFTGSLGFQMRAQAEEEPELPIPVAMHKLLKSVLKLDGLDAPGIFKKPLSSEALAAVSSLRARMESSVFGFKLKTSDPHVPAAALKDWLASIALPVLLPHTLPMLMRVGAMDDPDTLRAMQNKKASKRAATDSDDDDEEEEEERAQPKGKHAALAADLYADIRGGVLSPASGGGNSLPVSPHESVPQLLAQVVSLLPEVHRAVLATLCIFLAKLLDPRHAKRNGYSDSASGLSALATVFAPLLARPPTTCPPGKAQYAFYLERQYLTRAVAYLIQFQAQLFSEEAMEAYPDVPYPSVAHPLRGMPGREKKAAQPQPAQQPQQQQPADVANDYSDLLGPDGGSVRSLATAGSSAAPLLSEVVPADEAVAEEAEEDAEDDEHDRSVEDAASAAQTKAASLLSPPLVASPARASPAAAPSAAAAFGEEDEEEQVEEEAEDEEEVGEEEEQLPPAIAILSSPRSAKHAEIAAAAAAAKQAAEEEDEEDEEEEEEAAAPVAASVQHVNDDDEEEEAEEDAEEEAVAEAAPVPAAASKGAAAEEEVAEGGEDDEEEEEDDEEALERARASAREGTQAAQEAAQGAEEAQARAARATRAGRRGHDHRRGGRGRGSGGAVTLSRVGRGVAARSSDPCPRRSCSNHRLGPDSTARPDSSVPTEHHWQGAGHWRNLAGGSLR